ncbi:transposase [Streptomyces sp. NBC_00536]|uniref:transposase n=1 Tax=Streptomyces sp. NBC_00536 TaxID=2975769 RepID=UPI002E80B597|nr:transposase [Streptomyces sp. NBC_00536]WUC84040.1 transposase [Streptomyces sp. NBC_00536]
MPQDVREWLPPDHLCWKVLDVVDHLDLSEFVDSYRDDRQGRAAYPPQALIALLLYCYSKGIRSSRKIEQACFDDVGCRIITANRRVDHSTLARFVRRHREALKLLFVQVLAMCSRQKGLLNLAAVAVDGSPMEANASRDSNQRLQRIDRVISECEAEIDNMVAGSLQPDVGRDGGQREQARTATWCRMSGRGFRVCWTGSTGRSRPDRSSSSVFFPRLGRFGSRWRRPSAWWLGRRGD